MKFKFCPKCGGKFTKTFSKEDQFTRLVCQDCDFVFYQNPKPTATALILANDRILLGKRATEPSKGSWDLPGGFVEDNEHPIETLKREVKEELGISIKDIRFFGIYMDFYETTQEDTLNIFYLSEIKSGKIRAGSDLADYKWFDINNPPKNMAFDCQNQVMKDLQKHTKRSR